MIEFAIGVPCCDDFDAVVSMGRRDNALTNAVRGLLLLKPLMRNARKSYLKTIDLLRKVIYDPCCWSPITIDASAFTCGGDEPVVLRFVGLEGQGIFTVDFPALSNPYELSLPLIGNYIVSLNGPSITQPVQAILRDANNEAVGSVTIEVGGEPVSNTINLEGVTNILINCTPIPSAPTFQAPQIAIESMLVGNSRSSQAVFFATDGEFEVSYEVTGMPAFMSLSTVEHGIYRIAVIDINPVGAGSDGVYNLEVKAISGGNETIREMTITVDGVLHTRFNRPIAGANELQGGVGDFISGTYTVQSPNIQAISVQSFPALSANWGGGSIGTALIVSGEPDASDIGDHVYVGAVGTAGPVYHDMIYLKITVTETP